MSLMARHPLFSPLSSNHGALHPTNRRLRISLDAGDAEGGPTAGRGRAAGSSATNEAWHRARTTASRGSNIDGRSLSSPSPAAASSEERWRRGSRVLDEPCGGQRRRKSPIGPRGGQAEEKGPRRPSGFTAARQKRKGLAAATGEKGPRWYLGSDEVASRRPATDLPRRTATTPSSSVGPLSLRPAGTSPSIRRSHGSHFGRCRRRIASPPASSCHSPLCGPTTTGCGVTLSLHQDTRLSQTAVYGTMP